MGPVALRKESVDRNVFCQIKKHRHGVALRKESVDRNIHRIAQRRRATCVALRKESVDRNVLIEALNPDVLKSLSARRAWIEM